MPTHARQRFDAEIAALTTLPLDQQRRRLDQRFATGEHPPLVLTWTKAPKVVGPTLPIG